MQEVGIHGERRLSALGGRDLNAIGLSVGEELGAGQEVPFAPGGNDLDVRLEGVVAELEADLVIALPGGTVGHGIGAGLQGNLDLPLGDEGPGNGGSQKVDALIQGIGAEHGEHKVLHELLTEVINVDLLHTAGLGLPAGRLELLTLRDSAIEFLRLRAGQIWDWKSRLQPERGRHELYLAEVSCERDNLAAVLVLDPFQDDRGVKATGVSQDNLLCTLLGRCHDSIPASGGTSGGAAGLGGDGGAAHRGALCSHHST